MRNTGLGKYLFWLPIILLLTGLLGFPGHAKGEAAKVIKLGAPLPMSGPGAMWGDSISKIALMFVELINKDGGVKIGDQTYKLELVIADDKLTPEGAKTAAERLVYTEKVNAILGHWTPVVAGAVAPLATKENIVFIHSIPNYPGVLDPKWRTTAGGNYATECSPRLALLLNDSLPPEKKVKNIAVLVRDDPGGRLGVELLKTPEYQKLIKDAGLNILSYDTFAIGTKDWYPILTKIGGLKDKVQLLWPMAISSGDMAMLAKQAYEFNKELLILTSSTLTDIKSFIDVAGYEAAQQVFVGTQQPWSVEKPAPYYKEMTDRIREGWKAKYGTEFSYGGGFAWLADKIAIYLEAAKKAKSLDPAAIIKVIETEELNNFYGSITAGGEKTYGVKRYLSYFLQLARIQGYQEKVVGKVYYRVP